MWLIFWIDTANTNLWLNRRKSYWITHFLLNYVFWTKVWQRCFNFHLIPLPTYNFSFSPLSLDSKHLTKIFVYSLSTTFWRNYYERNNISLYRIYLMDKLYYFTSPTQIWFNTCHQTGILKSNLFWMGVCLNATINPSIKFYSFSLRFCIFFNKLNK